MERIRGDHTASAGAAGARKRRRAHRPTDTTDSFQLFVNQAMRYPLIDREQEVELAKRIERGDLEAKEQLVNANLRLVIKFARRYEGYGLALGDLVQEAMLGLIRAAEKFDWRRGYKFSTYAVLWIRQAIQRGLDNSGRAVRIPAHIAQRERKVHRTEAQLSTMLGREPTDEEVAAKAKLDLDEVMAVRDLTRVTSSLDAPLGDGETTLGELRGETTIEDVEEDLVETEREETLRAALSRLPENERVVIETRFGTGDRPAGTLRDAARSLGVSEGVARRLEAKGMDRLSADEGLGGLRAAA
ncbi:MAG: sigma-70 family RNA polymerase sigma factor [Solirubrobacterales bacterium]